MDVNSDAGNSDYIGIYSVKFVHYLTHNLIENLHHQVEEYVFKNFPSKVQLVKTGKREGLIRARIFGAKKATGQVLQMI